MTISLELIALVDNEERFVLEGTIANLKNPNNPILWHDNFIDCNDDKIYTPIGIKFLMSEGIGTICEAYSKLSDIIKEMYPSSDYQIHLEIIGN